MLLLGRREHEPHAPPVVRWTRGGYQALLLRVERRRWVVVAAAVVLTLAGGAALPFFGGTFLPDLKEGHFVLHMTAAPGTSLAESLRIGDRITAALLLVPAGRSVAQHAGRAEAGIDTTGTHYNEFHINLRPGIGGDKQEPAGAPIPKGLAPFPSPTLALKTL